MKFLPTTAIVATASLAAITTNAAAAETQFPTIVDLSLPEFADSPLVNNNPGATEVIASAVSTPVVRTVLVLEHGQVVADYARDDVDPSVPNQVFSTTKAWMSLAMGMLVQDGVLDLDETLGDIFDSPTLWQNITDADFRRAVTVRELLTMTSGLINAAFEAEEEDDSNTTASSDDGSEWADGGSGGGGSLAEAIQEPQIDANKTFSYLASNNILSYIIPQRTNYSTPRAYLDAKVFPALGIANDEMGWWRNKEGMEYSYYGILQTPTQMAKLGQLYLQKGKTNTGDNSQLINEDWVTLSSSLQGGNFFYGYLWWVWLGALLEQPELGTFYCAMGLGGQDVCVSPTTDRVIVQQRDLSEDFDPDAGPVTDIILLALAPSLNFSVADDSTDAEGDEDTGGNPISDVISAASWSHSTLCLWMSASLVLFSGLM